MMRKERPKQVSVLVKPAFVYFPADRVASDIPGQAACGSLTIAERVEVMPRVLYIHSPAAVVARGFRNPFFQRFLPQRRRCSHKPFAAEPGPPLQAFFFIQFMPIKECRRPCVAPTQLACNSTRRKATGARSPAAPRRFGRPVKP